MPKMHRNPNRPPSHPGAVLREIVLPGLDASKTDLAKALGISRNQLYEILAEKQPVTPITAVRLEAAIGGSARSWVNMQAAYDVWRAQRSFLKLPKMKRSIKLSKRAVA
jgi:antitoxin HigA-1